MNLPVQIADVYQDQVFVIRFVIVLKIVKMKLIVKSFIIKLMVSNESIICSKKQLNMKQLTKLLKYKHCLSREN